MQPHLLATGLLVLLALPVAPRDAPGAPDDAIATLGSVQGAVRDDDVGAEHTSPLVGQEVSVRGVIHLTALQPREGREPLHGFFLQNLPAQADGDPTTSDGIYVHLGTRDRIGGGEDGYRPVVGDEIVLRGVVEEYRNLTQIARPRLLEKIRSGVDLDTALPAVELSLPSDLLETQRSLERLEGMRVRIPAGGIVLGGRTGYDEIVILPASSPVAHRENPYTRRVFRDPHPLDNRPDRLFDDGNGERLFLGALGIARPDRIGPSLPPVRTFDTLAEPATGAIYFSYGKYQLEPAAEPVFRQGPDPSKNHPPGAPDRSAEFSIATYNVENLYDFRNDPTDMNDDASDPGAGGVRPPFNYLPASEVVYRARLSELARQIVEDLHCPDILLLQEAEDQDLGRIEDGELTFDGDADGRPDSVQELALAVARLGGPHYRAAFDRDGADVRGIVCTFLYRTDRVVLPPPDEKDPVLGANPSVPFPGKPHRMNSEIGNPRCLNAAIPDDIDADDEGWGRFVFSRAPQVALFHVFRAEAGEGAPLRLYAVNVHFSSRPDQRVAHRKAQAAYCAAVARRLLSADPGALVLVAGDFNVFPRPDDPFRPGQDLYPSDQLGALYDGGLANLYDLMLAEAPEAAYTYVFEGQAQTIDQVFVSPALRGRTVEARPAHVNCDWPADRSGDGARGASDHDPVVVRFRLDEG